MLPLQSILVAAIWCSILTLGLASKPCSDCSGVHRYRREGPHLVRYPRRSGCQENSIDASRSSRRRTDSSGSPWSNRSQDASGRARADIFRPDSGPGRAALRDGCKNRTAALENAAKQHTVRASGGYGPDATYKSESLDTHPPTETHTASAVGLVSSFLGDEKRFGVCQFLRDPSKFADCTAIRSADPVLRDLQQAFETAIADHTDLFE